MFGKWPRLFLHFIKWEELNWSGFLLAILHKSASMCIVHVYSFISDGFSIWARDTYGFAIVFSSKYPCCYLPFLLIFPQSERILRIQSAKSFTQLGLPPSPKKNWLVLEESTHSHFYRRLTHRNQILCVVKSIAL